MFISFTFLGALALLHKFPGEYGLVDDLLQCREGGSVFVNNPNERSVILSVIKRHQIDDWLSPSESSHLPEAAMREYVIRNSDSTNPCQLSARLVAGSGGDQLKSFNGSLLLALTCCHD